MSLVPGSRFDRYLLEVLLGEGARGVVYRARDEKLARAVALKVLRADAADASGEAFVREARAAAALSHPNIVKIHDVGDVDGTPFIAMELVEGRTLRALVGDASVPVAARLGYLADVARALAAAHAQGVLHRDVKPENVMVRGDGAVKVLDFGIARTLDAPPRAAVARSSSKTSSTESLDAFASVGQDAGVDQLGWGTLAFELLTGARQGGGGEKEALARVVDPAVASVVLRACAKRREDRFASMADLVLELARATGGAGRSGGLRKLVGGVGALAAVVALIALGVGRLRSKPALAPAPVRMPAAAPVPKPAFALHATHPRRITSSYECEEFPEFTPDGTRLLYGAQIGTTEQVFVRTLPDGPERALTSGDGYHQFPSVSPDGKLVAYLHVTVQGSATEVVDLEGREPPRRLCEGNARPRFSRDGSAVWCGDSKGPRRVDLATGKATRGFELPAGTEVPEVRELADGRVVASLPQGIGAGVAGMAIVSTEGALSWLMKGRLEEALALSPDGRFALGSRSTAANYIELLAVPVDGGDTIALPLTDVRVSAGLTFSPRGDTMAWSNCRGLNAVGSVSDKGAFVPLAPAEWQEQSVAGVAGTTSLAVVSERSGVASLWVVGSGDRSAARLVWTGDANAAPDDVDVSPDGKTALLELTGHGIAVLSLDDGKPRQLVAETATECGPRFTRSGREVLYTARPLRVFAAPLDGGPPHPVLEPQSAHAAPSPVDDRVAYLLRHEPSKELPMLADLATGTRRRLSPELGEGRYYDIAFSGDGKRVGVILGDSHLIEVDPATGAIVRHVDTKMTIANLHYVGRTPWVAAASWHGNVWMAGVEIEEGASP